MGSEAHGTTTSVQLPVLMSAPPPFQGPVFQPLEPPRVILPPPQHEAPLPPSPDSLVAAQDNAGGSEAITISADEANVLEQIMNHCRKMKDVLSKHSEMGVAKQFVQPIAALL